MPYAKPSSIERCHVVIDEANRQIEEMEEAIRLERLDYARVLVQFDQDAIDKCRTCGRRRYE